MDRGGKNPTLENEFLRLSFDWKTGTWTEMVWLPKSLGLINHERRPVPSVDFCLDGKWVRNTLPGQLVRCETQTTENDRTLTVVYEVGSALRYRVCEIPRYEIRVRYTLDAHRPILRRSASLAIARRVDYYGMRAERLTGARFTVPGVTVGDPIACTCEIPGGRCLPRTPSRIRASLGRTAPEGVNDFYSLLSAPDLSTGLLAVHNPKRRLTLMVGYECDHEPVFPMAWGEGGILYFEHHHGLAGDYLEGSVIHAGSQTIMMAEGDWPSARSSFRQTVLDPRIKTPTDRPAWARHRVIGEVSHHAPGGIAAMRKLLPAWKSMGIDTLYLMAPNPGGYAVASFEGIAPHLGTDEEMASFVKEAHSHGLRVLFDLLMTIQAETGDLRKAHPDWFVRDERGHVLPSIAWGGCSLDWDHPEFQDYIIQSACERVRRYDIDGFRVDAPEHKEANWGIDPPRKASDTAFGAIRLLEKLRPVLRAIKPDAALLSETHGPVFHQLADLAYAHPAYGVDWLIAAIESGRFGGQDLRNWLADQAGLYPEGAERLFIVKSHDVATPFTFADHPTLRPIQAIFSLIGGSVMIFVSHTGEHSASGTELDFCGEVFRLRKSVQGLDEAPSDFEKLDCNNDRIFCAWREMAGGGCVPVANLSPEGQTFSLRLPEGMKRAKQLWPDSRKLPVADDSLTLQLGPWEAVLFRLD